MMEKATKRKKKKKRHNQIKGNFVAGGEREKRIEKSIKGAFGQLTHLCAQLTN